MSDRERQILYIITYMWNLKDETKEWIWQALRKQRYREQTNGYQWREEEGQDRGRGLRGTNHYVENK